MTAEPNRKLSTIVFTDIVGYSDLMSKNESATLKMLDFHNRMAEEIFSGYRGNIIKKMGDGMLAVFNSVNDAYTATQLLQDEIKTYNNEHSDAQRLLVRIGIHVGDVIEKDGDIFGNGVNIAARLQQICVPGGICLSQSAHSALGQTNGRKLKLVSDVVLKNIAERYNVFMLPSIYPDEFRIDQLTEVSESGRDFVIKRIQRIPPEKFSLLDSLLITVGVMVAIDFGIANLIKYLTHASLNEVILELSGSLMFGIYNLVFIPLITITILRDSMKIDFEDVRGADELISFIIRQFGFKHPARKNGQLIFKPSVYNLLMWSSQKMRVSISGNHVTISGSFLFLRKVRKMLKAYRK